MCWNFEHKHIHYLLKYDLVFKIKKNIKWKKYTVHRSNVHFWSRSRTHTSFWISPGTWKIFLNYLIQQFHYIIWEADYWFICYYSNSRCTFIVHYHSDWIIGDYFPAAQLIRRNLHHYNFIHYFLTSSNIFVAFNADDLHLHFLDHWIALYLLCFVH